MERPDKYAAVARSLADRFMVVQTMKTAANERSKGLWDYARPENPDRPGANWMTGLGAGAMASGLETGVGRHGLTESGIRYLDRLDLKSNPGRIFKDKELMRNLADDEQTKFLKKLLTGSDKKSVGTLLSRNYGRLNTGNSADVNRIFGELQKIVGPDDTDLARRFNDLTTKGHTANANRAKKIFDTLDKYLADDAVRARPGMSPAATNQLTKLRTSFGKVETADDLEKLKKALRNLSTSVQGGKKGVPSSYVFGDSTRNLLNVLSRAPAETAKVQDANKIKDLVTSFGQFTKGRNVPSIGTRFRRGGIAGTVGTIIGAYGIPSLIDFARSFKNNSQPRQ